MIVQFDKKQVIENVKNLESDKVCGFSYGEQPTKYNIHTLPKNTLFVSIVDNIYIFNLYTDNKYFMYEIPNDENFDTIKTINKIFADANQTINWI